jgi:hypothetical protein
VEAAAIPVAAATIRSADVASKVVIEVKVRGEKGVLNGTPFLIWCHAGLPLSFEARRANENFAGESC